MVFGFFLIIFFKNRNKILLQIRLVEVAKKAYGVAAPCPESNEANKSKWFDYVVRKGAKKKPLLSVFFAGKKSLSVSAS